MHAWRILTAFVLAISAIVALITMSYQNPGYDSDNKGIVYVRPSPQPSAAIMSALSSSVKGLPTKSVQQSKRNLNDVELQLLQLIPQTEMFQIDRPEDAIECFSDRCQILMIQRIGVNPEQFRSFMDLVQSSIYRERLLKSGFDIDLMTFGSGGPSSLPSVKIEVSIVNEGQR